MSKSKSSSAPAQVWAPQAEQLKGLYGEAEKIFGIQEPINPMQQRGMDVASQYAGSQGLQNIIGGAQGALGRALDPSQQNPYLQQAMQSAIRPLTQGYQENVLSGITDEAARAGQTGSSRQGIAEGIAGREYLQQLGDITSGMAYQDYGAGMDRMMQGIGQAGQVANLGMIPSGIYGGVGQQQQQAPWANIERYRDVLGAPTVLGGARSERGGTASAMPFSVGVTI